MLTLIIRIGPARRSTLTKGNEERLCNSSNSKQRGEEVGTVLGVIYLTAPAALVVVDMVPMPAALTVANLNKGRGKGRDKGRDTISRGTVWM